MIYFIIVLIVSFAFSYVRERNLNISGAFVIVLSLIVLAGLRDVSVGRDTINYLHLYDNSYVSERIEPLFADLVMFCKSLNMSYNAFLSIVAALIYIPLFFFLKRWSVNIPLSLFVYISFSIFFFSNSFNILRNAISISFVLLFVGYFKNNFIKKAVIMALIAIGFHYSSVLAIILIIASKIIIGIKPRLAIILLSLSIIIGLTSSLYIDLFNSILMNAPLISNAVMDNYSKYLSDIAETSVNFNGIVMLIAPMSVISALSFLDRDVDKFFCVILFVGTVLGNIFVSVLYTYRLITFMTILVLIIIPQLYKSKKSYIRFAAKCITNFMAVYWVINLITEKNIQLMPYRFYFE